MATISRTSAVAANRRAPDRAATPTMSRSLKLVWATFGLLGLILVGYLLSVLQRPDGSYWTWLDGWVVCGVELVASVTCIARGLSRRPGRVAALTLGCSILSWTIGDVVLTIQSIGGATPPSPSLADVFHLAFYPLAYVAVVMFMREGARKLTVSTCLDGVIAGLGAAAFCGAFAFHDILQKSGSGPLATVTNLAYPIGDLLLLSLVIGGCAVFSGRRMGPWILLASGIALNVVGDTSNLFQDSFGATRFGITLDAIAWPVAILLLSAAVWMRRRPSQPTTTRRASGFVLPNLAAATALVILVVGSVHYVNRIAIAVAAATLLVVGMRLVLSVREMQALSHERHRQAVTDDLTGLSNRRHLFRVLDAFFVEGGGALMPGRSLAFLFIDLNHFKEVNDSFGHPAGDELLKQVGNRLSSALRQGDLLVRIGGDEFAVVLVDGDTAYATDVAQRITERLAEPFLLDVVTANIGASIGIALAPNDATYSAGLVWCADVAMYRAKLGNSPFATFERDLDQEGDQMRLLEELQAAIGQGHLVLHYQPQLNLRTGEIFTVEALLRWSHPRLGLLAPDHFLPIAEEAGLMGAITEWVLDEAVGQCAAWRLTGRFLTVAVNVSPTNLLQPGFADMVCSILERHDVPAENVILELTESSVISDFDACRHVIEHLKAQGVAVSIDDFGAGVTSLAYLSSLAVRELKLDRTFLAGLVGDDRDREIDLVRSTIELGHSMGLRIVAEGIEDKDTLELLSELGCDFAQGYFISRPKPASDMAFRLQQGADERPALVRADDAPSATTSESASTNGRSSTSAVAVAENRRAGDRQL
jgi:diguanylate cyclase (GGDEF)-like protein